MHTVFLTLGTSTVAALHALLTKYTMTQRVNQAVVGACPHHGLEVFQGASSSAASEEGAPAEGSDVRHFYNDVWLPRMREHLTLLLQQRQAHQGSDPEQKQQQQPSQGAADRKGNPKKVDICGTAGSSSAVPMFANASVCSRLGPSLSHGCVTQASRLPLQSLSARDMNTRQARPSRISIMR